MRLRLLLILLLLSVRAPGFAAEPTKGTQILWDRYGIPHIFAPDHAGLFYAYGYAQMEAHAELLLRLYAQARGRGAEFYGEQYLDSDRWVRTNGIPERAKVWAAQQSPDFAPLLRAFTEGLNAWAAEHAASLSPAAKAVLPLSTEDVLAHGMRVVHFDWLVSPSRIEQRIRQRDAAGHGSKRWAIAPSPSASRYRKMLY